VHLAIVLSAMILDDVRARYAAEIRASAHLESESLVGALAKVPREHFLGPGPWQILTPGVDAEYRTTTDSDPVHLYRDVLVAIDPVRRLNNGQPSYLAACIQSLELREGERVVHVGCGVGYYTAIMAEVVGPTGHVTGIEIDADLAARASRNLRYLQHVEVIHADGGSYDPGSCDALFVNAGATHPRTVWLDCLQPGGRLICYLTVAFDDSGTGKGAMLKVRREGQTYRARFLAPVSVFHCIGVRDVAANQRLLGALQRGRWDAVRSLRRDPHDEDDGCWLHGDDFCLATKDTSAGRT
jgi:protein-L-isoaspartate(D-aspartate) O-methyltransferase